MLPSKQDLRKQILSRRNSLSQGEIQLASANIQRRVIESDYFKSARSFGAYYPIGGEVRTEALVEAARGLGKQVSLPRMEGGKIAFYEYTSEKHLVAGAFGVMEPDAESKPAAPELVVVPGVAFDRNGHRLGYGKGYYDRYLSDTRVKSIGLAYEFQVVDKIPRLRHDRPVGALATESVLIAFG
ncbi:MAG TPA: 5-formyltetrahydrofolate cyclo-ligase [Nitrososphaera sp.]|nr:5-formyltetrahydrofolate cyclo-ligase [Nitrososphaera sp.]